ncbi:cyanate transporter [Burkholderia sp. WAC0059]|nr:cyanate transporter [Burkholderia sp. WAC0059]
MTLGDEPLVDAEVDSVPRPAVEQVTTARGKVLLGASLVLVALNLRPLFSSLGSLLPEVVRADGLVPAMASAITTVPVLCLGIFAPLSPALARRFGAEQVIFWLTLLLAAGTALRAADPVVALFVGTVLAGASIAVINVLLPGLIKRDFAERTGLMAGLYTMALCAGAAMAAGFTVPLERHFHGAWEPALAFWAIPAFVAALCWRPHVPSTHKASHKRRIVSRGLWQCALAWQVTIFMVLQSMLSFTVFGWLAPILRERGVPADHAGLVVSVSVVLQMLACLAAPGIAVKLPNQRMLNGVVVVLAVGGFLGCLFAPLSTLWLWATVQGIGQGALTSVALTLIVLRSRNAHIAAELSGMVQGVGYGVGAAGPLLVGVLHGLSGNFVSVGWMFGAVGAAAVIFGILAGRARHVKGVLYEIRMIERIVTEA